MKHDPWWKRNQPDPEWVAVILRVVAFILLILVVGHARAEACLTITVPPQAVIRQYDADTFTVFTFGPGGGVDIRVEGVNAPELSKKKGVPDEPGAREAKEFTRQWLAKGPFTVYTCGKKTLTRIEATVSRNGVTLAQELIAMGYNKP